MSEPAVHRILPHRLRRLRSVRAMVFPFGARIGAASRAAPRGPALTARFAAVLDGRTFNIEIPVPGTAAAEVSSAELRVVRRRATRSVRARIRPSSNGSCIVAATAVLTGEEGGLGLRPGSPWVLQAVLHTRSGTTSYAVLAAEPSAPQAAGPTVAAPPDATTGCRYEIRTTRFGRLGLTVRPPAPTAEVAKIDVDWLAATLRIRVLGCDDPVTGVEFTARSGEGRARVVAIGTRHRVRCDIPVRELARVGGAKETIFDVHLRIGNRRLRVGRFLHDVANPKPVLVPPAGIVWGAPGLSVNVRPYYTPAGNLAVACRPVGSVPANGES